MPTDPIRLQNVLVALDGKGLDASARAQIEVVSRHWGPGGWQRIAHLRMPTRLSLAEHWREIAPTHRRTPRGREIVQQIARGRPVEMVEEREGAPARLGDLVRLLETVLRGR